MTPQSQKNTLYAVAGLIGAVIVYKTFFNDDSGGAGYDPTGNGGVTNADVPTSIFNADRVATQLYDAMKDWGTDEEEVLAVLKQVTPAQFSLVVQKFGRRSYNSVTGDQTNYNPFSNLPLQNLAFWLKNELSTTIYATLRAKYPNSL